MNITIDHYIRHVAGAIVVTQNNAMESGFFLTREIEHLKRFHSVAIPIEHAANSILYQRTLRYPR